MKAFRLTAGEPLFLWGIALDTERPLLLPIPASADVSVIEGGQGTQAFRFEAWAADGAQCAPAKVWASVRPFVPVNEDQAIPLDADHSATEEIVKRCMATLPAAPLDAHARRLWAECARDVLVRNGRQCDANVLKVTGLCQGEPEAFALNVLALLRKAGFSPVGRISADVEDERNAEAIRVARKAEREAEAVAKLTTVHTFSGRWARVTVNRRRSNEDAVIRSLFPTPTEAGIYFYNPMGLPIPRTETILAPGISLVCVDHLTGTQAQRDEGNNLLPDGLALMLRDILDSAIERVTDIAEEDFDGDGRGPLRFFAGQLFREHVAELVHLARVTPLGPLAELAAQALWQLPLAYHDAYEPKTGIAFSDAIVWTEQALKAEAGKVKSTVLEYRDGVPVWVELPTEYPSGFPRPEQAAKFMRAACFPLIPAGAPAVWTLGSCLRAPTAQEMRLVRLSLDPDAFRTTVEKAVEGKDVCTAQEVWETLYNEGITESPTPTNPTRSAVSKLLDILLFRRKDHRLPDGSRVRLWVREGAPKAAIDAATKAREDQPEEAPPARMAALRGPLVNRLGKDPDAPTLGVF